MRNILLLIVLLCGGSSTLADSISPCSSNIAPVFSKNGTYVATICSQTAFQLLVIDGPSGLKQFGVVGLNSTFRNFILNDLGEVAIAAETDDGDSYTRVANYNGGLETSTRYTPGSVITDSLTSLFMDPGPVFHDVPGDPLAIDDQQQTGFMPRILITGLTDDGTITGIEQYAYEFHPVVSVNATWKFKAISASEPSSLSLFGISLLVLVLIICKEKRLHRIQ